MKLLLGDCIERMKELPDESIDAVVTDPPYGIRFMGQAWDGKAIEEEASKPWNADGHMRLTGSPDSPNRKLIHRSGSAFRTRAGTAGAYDFSLHGNRVFQEWTYKWALEAERVLKPGGHLLSFSSTRTYHRMVCGIENAGFQIRDTIMWIQGQGFPKSLNIEGGFGTNLKPSFEPVVLARKPLAGSVRDNVTRYGTGVLNIDASRIPATDSFDQVGVTHSKEQSEAGYQVVQRGASPAARRRQGKVPEREGGMWANDRRSAETYNTPRPGEELGRWPANVIISHHEDCVQIGTTSTPGRQMNRYTDGLKPFGGGVGHPHESFKMDDEEVGVWECVPGCPVGMMESEARFFYVAKVSVSERHAGIDEEHRNIHPTVKPIALMRHLCKLVTPNGGTLLDPFLGSGTTGIAAHLEKLDFVGIEREKNYMEIAQARIKFWQEYGEEGLRIVAERDARMRAAAEERERLAEMGQETLF